MSRQDFGETANKDRQGRERPRILIIEDNLDDLEDIKACIQQAIATIDSLSPPEIVSSNTVRDGSNKIQSEQWSLIVSDLSLNPLQAGIQGYRLLSEAVAGGFPCIGVSIAPHVLQPEFITKMYNELGPQRLFRFVSKEHLQTELPEAVKALLVGSPRSALDPRALEISMQLPDILDLSKFRVIADCFRFDENSRESLQRVSDRILKALNSSSGIRENFLLWAPSGTGKTFLIEQIMASRGTAIEAVKLDMVQPDTKEIKKFENIFASSKPVLCLIDEADKPGKIPLGKVFRNLDLNDGRLSNSIVFAVVGSSGINWQDLEATIRDRPSGKDFISRISVLEKKFNLPTTSLGDRAIVFAARVRAVFKQPTVAIHRAAMFYVLQSADIKSNRAIDDLVKEAFKRTGKKNRIDFRDLFEANALSFLDFISTHQKTLQVLWDRDIQVTDSDPFSPP